MGQQEKGQIGYGAVICVFLASLCFSTGGLFIKLIPWGALAINGTRNLIGAALIGIYLLITRHRIVLSRQVFLGALSLMGVTTLFTLANKLTTAANAIVLQFTAPVFVILEYRPFIRSPTFERSPSGQRSAILADAPTVSLNPYSRP